MHNMLKCPSTIEKKTSSCVHQPSNVPVWYPDLQCRAVWCWQGFSGHLMLCVSFNPPRRRPCVVSTADVRTSRWISIVVVVVVVIHRHLSTDDVWLIIQMIVLQYISTFQLVMWGGKIVRKISYSSGKFPKISIVFFRKISSIFP